MWQVIEVLLVYLVDRLGKRRPVSLLRCSLMSEVEGPRPLGYWYFYQLALTSLSARRFLLADLLLFVSYSLIYLPNLMHKLL